MMNILIVGLGSIAKKHIIALNSLSAKFKIYALRSGKDDEAQEGIMNVYDIKDLTERIDFAIISNPTRFHDQSIRLLLEKGINLFIEKPPVSSMDSAFSLIEEIKKKGIKSYVACNLRFHPCLQYLKTFLVKNPTKRINEVNVYCGSYLPDWRPNKDFRTFYSTNPEMGGGVHLDLFHELDYIHWIFGCPLNARCLKTNHSSLNIKSIDYANYMLEYEGFTTSVVLNYYRREAKRSIEILFEDETWTVDLIKCSISNGSEEMILQINDFNIGNTYRDQMKYFITCLTDNQDPMNTFAESIETLKTCLCNE